MLSVLMKTVDIAYAFRYHYLRADTLLFRVGGGTDPMKPGNHHAMWKGANLVQGSFLEQ